MGFKLSDVCVCLEYPLVEIFTGTVVLTTELLDNCLEVIGDNA